MTDELVIGLISDTHMPKLLETLPQNVLDAFKDVALIIHAGDVGELWVLDELSKIAPVVAVHGNDETVAAQEALPFLQTVMVGGQRIVITHGHYPDVAEEMALRSDNTWETKLNRLAAFGKAHGASIVITGHTHIAMQQVWDGVTIINPGTPLYGNGTSKQLIRSVARLYLSAGNQFRAEHLDLNNGLQPFTPQLDVPAGFLVARFWAMSPIVEDHLDIQLRWFAVHVLPIAREIVLDCYYKVVRRHWHEPLPPITPQEMMHALQQDSTIPAAVFDKLRESEYFARYL